MFCCFAVTRHSPIRCVLELIHAGYTLYVSSCALGRFHTDCSAVAFGILKWQQIALGLTTKVCDFVTSLYADVRADLAIQL